VFGSVKEARHLLEGSASELDAERMLLPDVDATIDELAAIRRLTDGMLAKLARRKGDAKAVARALHVSTGEVRAAVETAELLAEFPETDAAVRRGELSAREAQLIAGAAIVNPDAEAELLKTATQGLVPLKDACVNARAAVEDPGRRRTRQQQARFHRVGVDDEGMIVGSYRLGPEHGGPYKDAFAAKVQEIFRAHKSGEHESHEAYAADALVAFVLGGEGAKVKVSTHVVIDHGALLRDRPVEGEVCEIAGVGPVDPAWVKEILGESFLTAIVKNGKDISTVAHLGRHVPAEVMTALIVQGHECGIEGCHNRGYLERDHMQDYAKGGPTAIWNMLWLCYLHHRLKTSGWLLGEPDVITGKRTLRPPP